MAGYNESRKVEVTFKNGSIGRVYPEERESLKKAGLLQGKPAPKENKAAGNTKTK